jgi:hypothetical protein
MIRDDKVLIMGEEVARYNGAYKVSPPHLSLLAACGSHECPHLIFGQRDHLKAKSRIGLGHPDLAVTKHSSKHSLTMLLTRTRSPRVSLTSSERTVSST